jgi:alkanesulfonate monooxygenase SsuD/methylene tetrahydromethanopterin reductase-like flavin-dependent oxidoreductase (luciferase family)
MKLGIHINYSGAKMDLPLEQILLAERAGFDSLFTGEAYGSEAFVPLGQSGDGGPDP